MKIIFATLLFRLTKGITTFMVQRYLLWSSHGKGRYCQAVAYSDNGEISGNWIQQEKLLFRKNGGHGMSCKRKTVD